MWMLLLALLATAVPLTTQLAQPKGFTDDPYVDDDKFIEKGDMGDFLDINQLTTFTTMARSSVTLQIT